MKRALHTALSRPAQPTNSQIQGQPGRSGASNSAGLAPTMEELRQMAIPPLSAHADFRDNRLVGEWARDGIAAMRTPEQQKFDCLVLPATE